MKIKFHESKTAFRNINGMDISDDDWQKSVCRKACQEFVDEAKRLDLKIIIKNKDGKEIKKHPFLDILNTK